ncbi:hypothetical protein CHLRE_03g144304v5 [Chlamydomonas reinhardtii]|uniref:Uncharacterized protein n=1 Tax=Chlamydomonas reinhardtii TaxID=3055 RepID=A0A2K3DV57_CHLRE|nr:uncharacterized protein CHLRE_03g144304v5 [Chlamydomonas reinhardtii]PNW84406.1 hypothetical protein CHLRE_03g144304v5 [Chlamydomonas reinhardtii]
MASAPEQEQSYEIDDGRPVNESLQAAHPPDSNGEPRRAFADISSNFTEFYAAALAAAQDMKSPPRSNLGLGFRYSPAKPTGSAAKRLWSGNELPPLPRPGGTNAQRVMTALAAARGPQDGSTSVDGSPTRHAPLARTAPGDGRPPLPSLGPLSAAAVPQPVWAAGGGGGGGGASRASSLCSNEVPPPALVAGRAMSQRTVSAGSGALLCCSGGLSFSAAGEQEGVSGGTVGTSGSGSSSGSGASSGSFGAAASSSGGGPSCAAGGARPLHMPLAVPMPADLAAAAAPPAGSRAGADTDTDMDVDQDVQGSEVAGSRAAGGEAGSGAGSPGDADEVDGADENAGVAGVPAVRMGSTVRTLSFNAVEVGTTGAAGARVGLGLVEPPSPFPHLENQPFAEHRPRSRQ